MIKAIEDCYENVKGEVSLVPNNKFEPNRNIGNIEITHANLCALCAYVVNDLKSRSVPDNKFETHRIKENIEITHTNLWALCTYVVNTLTSYL